MIDEQLKTMFPKQIADQNTADENGVGCVDLTAVVDEQAKTHHFPGDAL